MSDVDYHSRPEISCSMLKLFEESRQLYYHTYVTKRLATKTATREMDIGTICHAMFLEAKKFDELVIAYPKDCLKENGDLNGKPAKKFRDEHPDWICMKPSELPDTRERCKLVMASIDKLLTIPANAIREQPVFANLYGLDMKCKPDIRWSDGGVIRCVDLKIVDDPSPTGFNRSASRFRYHIQDAHYSAVLNRATGKPVSFTFIVAESKFPYRVAERNYGIDDRGMASSYHADLCGQLYECQKANNWDEVWDNEIDLKPWDCGGVPDLEGFANGD